MTDYRSMEDVRRGGNLEEAMERYDKTIKRWKNSWWEVIEDIYSKFKEWGKKYILDPATQTVKKVQKTIHTANTWGDTIVNNTNIDPKLNGREWCYLFRFYDKNDELVCSKVGTTTRNVWKRLQEELRSKTYFNCVRAEIDRIYDCGEFPAEGLESLIRSKYIQKYPKSFQKNDRFIKTLFDLDEIDTIASNYLAIA